MKTFKKIGLIISFCSTSMFIAFLMSRMLLEVDSSNLLVIGTIFFLAIEYFNGVAHGNLIRRLDNE